jgi:dienelactone hydrolase
VLWVGGIGGGWDTPAKHLYPRLAERLQQNGIGSLRIRFRNPSDLEEAVHDVLTGLGYLEQEGVERVGLVGHSFGGAVVIEAAATTPRSRAVVTLATQSYGTDRVGELNSDCALLLIHGTRDSVLAPANSQYVHRLAHEPKRLQLYGGAAHGLDEAAEEVEGLVHAWLVTHLKRRPE